MRKMDGCPRGVTPSIRYGSACYMIDPLPWHCSGVPRDPSPILNPLPMKFVD
jgi:hypothetical protein